MLKIISGRIEVHYNPQVSHAVSILNAAPTWISYNANWDEKDPLHLCRINLADLVNISYCKYCPTLFVREITNLEERGFVQYDSQER